MLEQKIEQLESKLSDAIAAIEALTVAIYSQPVKVDPEEDLPVVGKMSERKTEAPKTEALEQPELVEVETPSISRDDLQEMCMQIVRTDRTKKDAVKDAIASFDGASVLKEVKDEHLEALKAKLEALK